MTFLFIALLCAGMMLLGMSAARAKNTNATWTWYAGIGCVTVAAFIAAFNGWAT